MNPMPHLGSQGLLICPWEGKGEMSQTVKNLPCKHKDLSQFLESTWNTQAFVPACANNFSPGEVETAQLSPINKSWANERPCLENQVGAAWETAAKVVLNVGMTGMLLDRD